MKPYGKELIIDMHQCDISTFTKKSISGYCRRLCELINMERCKLYWWEELEDKPHLKGLTAFQFIKTSSIVIHSLDLMESIYINIFSCKEFDEQITTKFTKEWFKGYIANSHVIQRV